MEGGESIATIAPKSWARRYGVFAMLALSGAASSAGLRALAPLQEILQRDLALSDNQVSLVQGTALAIPVVLCAIPLGMLVDRVSRIRLLFALTLLAGLGSIGTALADSFTVLFGARMLVGFATSASIVCGFSLLADLFGPAQRGRAKSVLVMGQYGASAAVFAAGGMLVEMLPGSAPWRAAAFWLTVPLFALVALGLCLVREPTRRGVARQNATAAQAVMHLWHRRTLVLPLMAGIVAAEMPLFAIGTWAVPMWTRSFALSAGEAGQVMATAMLISSVLGPILGGLVADYCQAAGGPRLTVLAMAAGALLCGVAGLFPLVPDVQGAAILLTACVTLTAANVSMGVTLFTVTLPNDLRGLCLAILAALNSIFAIALAPLAVSALSGAIGGPATIGTALAIVCTVASLACAGIYTAARHSVPAEITE